MLKNLSKFAKKQEGATAIEYALLVVVIALAMYVAAGTVGTALSGKFTTVGTDITGAG